MQIINWSRPINTDIIWLNYLDWIEFTNFLNPNVLEAIEIDIYYKKIKNNENDTSKESYEDFLNEQGC